MNHEQSQNIRAGSPQLTKARLTGMHTYKQNSITLIETRNLHYFILLHNTLCTACTGIFVIPILYHQGCVLT